MVSVGRKKVNDVTDVDAVNERINNDMMDAEDSREVLLAAYLPRGFGHSSHTVDTVGRIQSTENVTSRNTMSNNGHSKLPHNVTRDEHDERLVESNHTVDAYGTQNTEHTSNTDQSGRSELLQTISVESEMNLDSTDVRDAEKTENSRVDVDENVGRELHHTVLSDQLDTDEVEIDEDDITAKLLSIQVLPRIPKKRKLATNDSVTTSATEASSYCSVLERINSESSSASARYPNWSAAGWTRSNPDRPPIPKTWTRKITKDKKVETKPTQRQTVFSEKYLDSIFKPKTDSTATAGSKVKRVADHSAWSPNASDVAGGSSLSEIEQISVEAEGSFSPALTGPLPTLPFEEQMRERARLRKLKQQQRGTSDIANENADTTDSVLKNCENSKDDFDAATVPSFHTNAADSSKPVVSHSLPDTKVPSFTNSSVPVQHTKNVERRRSPQHRSNENGQTRDHKPVKLRHQTSRSSTSDKSNRSHTADIQTTKTAKKTTDEVTPKFKKEPSSPPLPHLPVLPLFATSVESNSSSHPPESKTKGSRTKTATMTKSVRKDSSDVTSLNLSRPKPPTSTFRAGPTPAKSVSFNSKTKSQEAGETKKKFKPPKFQYKDKESMQQCVINAMKAFLKPYYTRNRITKEQYKEIMRSSVTRICRGCPPEGEVSASRVRKYAEAYLDKTLQLNVEKAEEWQSKAAL